MNYAVIDTEGSGLFDYTKPADAPGQPRMAAMGIILVNGDLEVEQEHGFLIRPEGWTFDDTNDAAKVNGLTQERLMAEGVDVKEPLRLYGDAIDQRRIVVAFNVLHDLKTLRAELRYAGFPDRFMQTRHICAMQGCRKLVDARTADGKKKAPKLAEACAFFGIDQQEGAHTGLGDARSALEILRRLKEAGQFPAFTDPYEKAAKR
jgi:DNA polymerase III epsilon subunit-like protein